MFERFTDRARRVIVLAQDEAKLLNHNFIGTEHILLGLIHEGEGVAAKALESMDISLDAVRSQAALRALQNPQLSVSEAAAQAGFAENSSFTRWFSKHFQQSPSSWRQQNLNRSL